MTGLAGLFRWLGLGAARPSAPLSPQARVAHPSLRVASRVLLYPLALGLVVRLSLLLAGGSIGANFDEVIYLEYAVTIDSGGVYVGAWPPGYPAVIALMLRLFGLDAVLVLRLLQVLCSLVIGFGIVQMSHRLFGVRGALVSGYGWACYLPLAFYTHHLWPETLFLCLLVPSMYVVVCFLLSDTERQRWGLQLAAAGALFGLSLYLKESLLYLPIPLTLALFCRKPRASARTVLAFPLAVAAVLTPLVIRNWDYYDRFVPAGASLGINVHAGLNKYYVNPDYNRDPDLVWRVHRDEDGQLDFVGRHFLEYGDGWKTSTADNRIDVGKDNLEIALRYALEHPGGFVLTRVKKAADLATPLSFIVRDLSPEVYSGVLVSSPLRRTLIAVSLLSVVVLLPLSWVNLVRIRGRRNALLFFLLIFGYVGLTAMLISMSRVRIPAVPFMLVLAGATLVEQPGQGRAVTLWLSAAGLVVLLLFWLMNLGEVGEVVARSWG